MEVSWWYLLVTFFSYSHEVATCQTLSMALTAKTNLKKVWRNGWIDGEWEQDADGRKWRNNSSACSSLAGCNEAGRDRCELKLCWSLSHLPTAINTNDYLVWSSWMDPIWGYTVVWYFSSRNVKFKALVRNFLILMNVRYIQAIAKWVATKLMKARKACIMWTRWQFCCHYLEFFIGQKLRTIALKKKTNINFIFSFIFIFCL